MRGNKVRLNSYRAKAWKVMRGISGAFTASEIATIAEASHENVQRYICVLHHAGYLRKAGNRRHEYLYRLVKNTGPKPPVQKEIRYLYDPNTDSYWSEAERVTADIREGSHVD
jgi:hypothetical protein